MKSLLVLLVSMVALSANAETVATVTVATGLPNNSDSTVEAFFGFQSKTEKSWVQIHVGEWNGDSYSWEKAQHIAIDGLSYDASAKNVIFRTEAGVTVICGHKSLLATHHLKLTGRCQLAKVKQGNSLSVVLTVK